jgi:hypothetical protein
MLFQNAKNKVLHYYLGEKYGPHLEDRTVQISKKVREYLFHEILCKELSRDQILDPWQFECFKINFFIVNINKNKLIKEQNEQVFRTKQTDLDGLETLFHIFTAVGKDCPFIKDAITFLADLYLYNEQEKNVKRGKTNMIFFDKWLEMIMTVDQDDEYRILSCLNILFNFVYRYDGHHMNSESFEKLDVDLEANMQNMSGVPKRKTFKVCKEMTIGAIRKIIADFYSLNPSEVLIISSKSYLSEC